MYQCNRIKMNLDKIKTTDIGEADQILKKYGVAILEDYFDDEYADKFFESVKQWLIGLNIGLTNDISTWRNANMPLGPRYGMFQSIISNAPQFWKLREEFHALYKSLLGEAELITSIDGASIFPTKFSPKKQEDWAHIDQTESSDFRTYQSQFVASDTTASFVCTPKSHLAHATILKKFAIPASDTNWHKFTNNEVTKLTKMFGDTYQIPIYAKKGSVIFWDSRTIHSAKYPDSTENKWRAVFYISMQPIKTLTAKNIETIKTAIIKGKTTNHLGSRIFTPFDRFKNKNDNVTTLLNNSWKLSHYYNLNQNQKRLAGFMDYNIKSSLNNTQYDIIILAEMLCLPVAEKRMIMKHISNGNKCELIKILIALYQKKGN